MINYNEFIHPSDKKALEALKAVPGFDAVTKKFMSIIGEKIFQLQTTSSFLKLGPDQLPEIYNILVKVCKRLEIDIPELYLALDRTPNAYTSGDTDIFIVIHSGLLETLNLEQIETVIAHECGHIVCHHVLYHTMGNLLLQAADLFVNGIISKAVVTSLQYAFAYWMRCSEFSADRVSAYYHGSAEPVINVMMALSGGTDNLKFKLNRDAFFKQAQDYKVLIDNSTYNKVLEFVLFGENTHPLNAYRAYEINEFYKKYDNILTMRNSSITDGEVKEYNLRIKFEYIKHKNPLKINKLFTHNTLEFIIDENENKIEKNDVRDFVLNSNKYNVLFKCSEKELEYSFELKYDMTLVVTWDGNTEKLTIREEI